MNKKTICLLLLIVGMAFPLYARHGCGRLTMDLIKWARDRFDEHREKCPDCFGAGVEWMVCAGCSGKGGMMWFGNWNPCGLCNGDRIVRTWVRCETCGGTGKKPIEWGKVIPIGIVVLIVVLVIAHKYGILEAISKKYF